MNRLAKLLILLGLLALTGCVGVVDLESGSGVRNDARKALNSVLDRCPGSSARFQASTTNEAGAVWFTLRCERPDAISTAPGESL